MTKRKTKKSINVLPWIVAGVLGVPALAFYVKTTTVDKVATQDLKQQAGVATPAKAMKENTVRVVKPHASGMDLSYTSTETKSPGDQDPTIFALNEYLHQIPAVDAKAHVLSVSVKDRVANLSMSKEFGLSYGSEDEKLILDGIATTLGGIDGIDKFTLTMDGQKIDSLGHADLSDPMPVMRKGGDAKQSEASAPSRPR